MELQRVRVEPSPRTPGYVRLAGDVAYDDRPGQLEEYWFDVPETLAPSLSATGNPWLLCLIPLAATLGETLRIPLPVDRRLARNVRELMAIWKFWYPKLHIVDVELELADGPPAASGDRVASFFSAGVDSFFSLLRSTEPGAIAVDDLITVQGFDIGLPNTAAHGRRRARMVHIAERMGKTAWDVATNLRYTRLRSADWGRHWHGCGLASVALALEGRFRSVLIASTHSYPNLVPWGSHPLTDPHFSTSRTDFVHDGATHTRFSKIEYLARHEIALSHLHVCFRHSSEANCGNCEKCVRTMTALEILGRLHHAASFAGLPLNLDRLAHVYLPRPGLERYYRAMRQAAGARGRRDVVQAIDRAFTRSRILRKLMALPIWLNDKRGLWRAASPIRRALLAKAIV